MPIDDEFNLEVEFTGLCLYDWDREAGNVTVLMPDCRRTFADDIHSDKTRGAPHVGYLRVNLANIALVAPNSVPLGDPMDGPRFEVTYQFDREKLDFLLAVPEEEITVDLGLPNSQVILPGRAPDSKLFDAKPPESLLFRTELHGGTLQGRPGNGNWEFKGITNGGAGYESQFAEVITWKRKVKGDRLDLTLSKFDEPTEDEATEDEPTQQDIRLIPVTEKDGRKVLRLKIANLCSTNPLEWESLTTHTVTTRDLDFKWFYRLFTGPALSALPIPEQTTDLQAFGAEDCTGVFHPHP